MGLGVFVCSFYAAVACLCYKLLRFECLCVECACVCGCVYAFVRLVVFNV